MAELPEPLARSAIRPSEPRASILLVDDNPANLLSLRAILDDLGQNLVEARSGEEALERVQVGGVRRRPARRADAGHRAASRRPS